ncbi:MAG: hypothetical protein IJL84_04720 [Paludibacteraceae bacterium]|nr:hypothetical protein [Paludibacteraceae bacterium]
MADSIQIVLDTAAKDSVLPDTPKTLLYDTEIFIYDTAYFVDPNQPLHKYVKYKAVLAMPSKNDSDKLVTDIRFDVMNFATERLMTDPIVATTGYFASVATRFKTEFRAADEFSKSRYFDWTVARFTKNTYQDSRLYCMAKGIYENTGSTPLFGLSYSNWDKKLKEKVEYEDLFSEKDVEDIRNVLVGCMVKKYGVVNEDSLASKGISVEQIAPSRKFLLTKDTIYFVYSPYELGMEAERSVKIPVANKQLRQFMDTTKSIVRYLLED